MKNKIPMIALSVVCIIALLAMVLSLTFGGNKSSSYTPPPFDSTAEVGTPTVPENLGYSKIYQDGMGFTAWVCGKVTVNHNAADVYFTNESENTVWLKLRILDESGSTLGETGLIKPGEYVKSITFDTAPQNGQKIKLKIMAYEPETYYSAGAVALNTTISKGE